MTEVLAIALVICVCVIIWLLISNGQYHKMLEKTIDLLGEAAMKLDQSSKCIHALKDERMKLMMELEEYKGV